MRCQATISSLLGLLPASILRRGTSGRSLLMKPLTSSRKASSSGGKRRSIVGASCASPRDDPGFARCCRCGARLPGAAADPRDQSLSMFQNTIGLDLRMPCTLLRAAYGVTYCPTGIVGSASHSRGCNATSAARRAVSSGASRYSRRNASVGSSHGQPNQLLRPQPESIVKLVTGECTLAPPEVV